MNPRTAPKAPAIVLDLDAYGLLFDVSTPGDPKPTKLEEHLTTHLGLDDVTPLRRVIRALEQCHLGVGPGEFERLSWEGQIAFLARAARLLSKPIHPLLRSKQGPEAGAPYSAARTAVESHFRYSLDDRFTPISSNVPWFRALRFDGLRADLRDLLAGERSSTVIELRADSPDDARRLRSLARAGLRQQQSLFAPAKPSRRKRKTGTIWLDIDDHGHVISKLPSGDPRVPTLREYLVGHHGVGKTTSFAKLTQALLKSYANPLDEKLDGSDTSWPCTLEDFLRIESGLDARMDLDLFCERSPSSASEQGAAVGVLGHLVYDSDGLLTEEVSRMSSFTALRLNGSRDELRAFLAEVGLHPRVQVVEGSEEELEDEQDALDAELRAEMEKEDEETS